MFKNRLNCLSGVPLVLSAYLLSAPKIASAQGVTAPAPGSPSIPLTSYADTWADSQQRWWDIASYKGSRSDFYNQYNGWTYTPIRDASNTIVGYSSPNFSYANAGQAGGPSVTVTYDKAPNVPYFVGHIEASNLKPNFAYQVKLVGKPTYGPRGAGPFTKKQASGVIASVPDGGGEDWANSQLGHIGRWWNDSNASGNTNAVTDSVYASTYPTDTIYGYIFMGDFVTGSDGKASVDFTGENNYHITFQNWQSGRDVRMVQNGTPAQLTDVNGIKYFPIIGSPATGTSYAYGGVQPSTNQTQENGYKNVYLWYQYESSMTAGRPRAVNLSPGRYHCRVMLTEESFHNNYGATSSAYGGKWEGVLINEDFAKSNSGQTIYDANGYAVPDTAVSNDIVFDIKDSSGNFVVAPTAPTDLKANWNTDSSKVLLSWGHSALPNSNYYFNIKRAEVSGGPYATIAGGVDTANTSYADETASSNKTYFYVVSAVNSGVEGANSTEITIAPQPPTAPSDLGATAYSSSEIGLTWLDHANNEDGFALERTIDTSAGWTEIAQLDPNITSYSDKGLSQNTIYYYRVRAYNKGGYSAYSVDTDATDGVQWWANTASPVPPAAPINVSATLNNGQVVLTWSASAGATTYTVKRSTTQGSGYLPIGSNLTGTTFTDTSITNGFTYYYVISATGEGGTSKDSAEVSVKLAPSAPSGLTATRRTATRIDLAWVDNSTNESGFIIERSTDNLNWAELVRVGTNVITYSNLNLASKRTYYYRVRAFNGSGSSAYSNTASATT